MEAIAQQLSEFLSNNLPWLPSEAIIFIISMIPILELRGGVFVSALLGMPLIKGNIICLLGNIVPIPFILLFIRKIFSVMKKTKLFAPLIEKLENKAMSKSDSIKKYEFLGLILFVGIPLPGTGAWTGALIAALLEVDIKKASLAIFLGLIMATIIMDIVSYSGLTWIINQFSMICY